MCRNRLCLWLITVRFIGCFDNMHNYTGSKIFFKNQLNILEIRILELLKIVSFQSAFSHISIHI